MEVASEWPYRPIPKATRYTGGYLQFTLNYQLTKSTNYSTIKPFKKGE